MYPPIKCQTSPPAYSRCEVECNNVQPSAPPNEMDSSAPMIPYHEFQVIHPPTVIIDDCRNGLVCPHCEARVRISVEQHATGCTYFWSAMLCVFCCWPCACLPCCCKCAYETTQFCPNCKGVLGRF